MNKVWLFFFIPSSVMNYLLFFVANRKNMSHNESLKINLKMSDKLQFVCRCIEADQQDGQEDDFQFVFRGLDMLREVPLAQQCTHWGTQSLSFNHFNLQQYISACHGLFLLIVFFVLLT